MQLGPPTSAYVEEIVRQMATQSALLAGFAFAGLTAISLEPAGSRLAISFGVCASLSIVSEVFSLFLSGFLTFVGKEANLEKQFESELTASWVAYLFGLLMFLVSVALLSWIKVRPAALVVTIIIGLGIVAMGVCYHRIAIRKKWGEN